MGALVVFYDKFEALCKEKGISTTKAITSMGMSRALVTKWKNPDMMPNGKTLAKLSEFFEVPVDYFTRGTIADTMEKAMRSLPGYKDPLEDIDQYSVDDIVKYALFGDVEVSDEVYEEVKRFAKFAKEQNRK